MSSQAVTGTHGAGRRGEPGFGVKRALLPGVSATVREGSINLTRTKSATSERSAVKTPRPASGGLLSIFEKIVLLGAAPRAGGWPFARCPARERQRDQGPDRMGGEMTILRAPAGSLTDSVVEVRLPSPDAGDITTINRYVQDDQLDGGWLPDVPLVTGEQLVKDWTDCWNGHCSRDEPTFTFVVTVAEEPGFVGVVGIAARDDAAFDLTYGTAPAWRGHGLASRATRLAAQWVARQPGVRTVEILIDEGERASERVAVNAGFVLADPVSRSDPESGETTVELRYIMDRPADTESL
jgi:RimJ/RimL family protein N-acetyltransferase